MRKLWYTDYISYKEGEAMEYNDVYDENRQLTGKIHRRGTSWKKGEFGLVVCVWVYDGEGKLLLTGIASQPMRVFRASGIDKIVEIKEAVS